MICTSSVTASTSAEYAKAVTVAHDDCASALMMSIVACAAPAWRRDR
jgi:hypothetical protein